MTDRPTLETAQEWVDRMAEKVRYGTRLEITEIGGLIQLALGNRFVAGPDAPIERAVLFILTRKGEVLVERCQEKAKYHPGFWFIPGGRIERGESALEALHRELSEELGVVVEPEDVMPLPLVDATGSGPGPFLMRPFLITKWTGDLPDHCLDHPETPLRWATVSELLYSACSVVRAALVVSGLHNLPVRWTPEGEFEPVWPEEWEVNDGEQK